MPNLTLDRSERLRLEEEKLRELADSSPSLYQVIAFDGKSGTAVVGISLPERDLIKITVHYHNTFPFERPYLMTDDPSVQEYRHVNRYGAVCTLRYEPDEWDPDHDTTADIIPRVWKLLMREGNLDESEDDGTVEPLDFTVSTDPPIVFVDESLTTHLDEHSFGSGLLVGDAQRIRMHVTRLSCGQQHLYTAEQPHTVYGLAARANKTEPFFWFKATRNPPLTLQTLNDLKDLMTVEAWKAANLTFPNLKRDKNGDYTVLIVFNDETGSRWIAVNISRTRLYKRLPQQTVLRYLTTYVVGPDSLFGRLDGIVDRSKVRDAHALIVGAGALGSEAAFQLHRSGFGHLTVVDPERITPGNPVRSEYGLNSVGAFKVQELESRLGHHLPLRNYRGLPGKIPDLAVMEGLRERHKAQPFTAILVAVGHHHLSRMLERELQSFGVPVVYTWTTRGAAAGVVLTAREGKGTYEDYHGLHEAGKLPDLPSDDHLPNRYDGGCTTPALPAAPLDTRVVANHAARAVLELALGEQVPYLQMWTRKPYGRFPGMAWFKHHLDELNIDMKRRPVPEDLAVKRVEITYSCTLELEKFMRDRSDLETGGLLFGRIENSAVHIHLVTGPGPNAIRTKSTFAMDNAYAQGWLDAIFKLDPKQNYLGEWHSHPGAALKPSGVDERAAMLLTNDEGTQIDVPVLLICKLNSKGDFEGKAYVLQPDGKLQNFSPAIDAEFVLSAE